MTAAADAYAVRHWANMGCASEAHGAATAKWAWAFRRRLGIAAFRANARLLIGNMRHVRRAAAPRSAAAAARGAAEGTLGTEGTRYCDADGLHTAIGGGQVVRARTSDDRT